MHLNMVKYFKETIEKINDIYSGIIIEYVLNKYLFHFVQMPIDGFACIEIKIVKQISQS